MEIRKVLATTSLMIATFLNPFGFDILVFKLTQLTNDYWSTMYVLYGLAFLLLFSSYFFFKSGERGVGNLLVTLGLFFNPLGYDWIVYGILQITGDYWFTMCIMYGLATTFFGMYVYFSDIQFIRLVKHHTKKTKHKIAKKLK